MSNFIIQFNNPLSIAFIRCAVAPLALSVLLTACSPVDDTATIVSSGSAGNTKQHNQEAKTTDVPDFASIKDVQAKKAAFFSYLQPAYDLISSEILAIRAQLFDWQQRVAQLSPSEKQQLADLAAFYKASGSDDSHLIVSLLQQVDILPEALVLSQAANESGWGTSRFAQYGYNFFGQWCFNKGCGFVPSQRDTGANHEVAKFETLAASVRSYHRNINRNARYLTLRELRSELRQQNEPFNACILAQGLEGYSERKQEYVNELQNMMRQNRQYWRDNQVIDYLHCVSVKN